MPSCFLSAITMPSCRSCCLSLRWRLLAAVLGAVLLHGDGGAVAASRPLLGIAEPPGGAAAGPASASRPGGGGRPDRSVAGADVILVGFAAAVIVVIFCYIRITRQNSSGSRLGLGGKQEGL